MAHIVKTAKPEGCNALHFKHEDEDRRIPVGPVYWVVGATPENPYSGELHPVAVYEGETDFAGNPSPCWYKVTTARQIAKDFGLTLREA